VLNPIDNTIKHHYPYRMNNSLPTTAYLSLEDEERYFVDEYVLYAIGEQGRKRERIVHALSLPIPAEYVTLSKSVLLKPLVRAAVAERLREEADKQDISPSKVISEHAQIAFSNIADYLESLPYGDFRVMELDKIPAGKMGAVKSIETKPGRYGLATKVILHDKHASLRAMGEMMGLIAPDKPRPLLDYVAPPGKEDENADVPEDEYKKLLEQT